MALDILATIAAWSALLIHPYVNQLSNVIAALVLALWGKDIFYQKVGKSGIIRALSNRFQARNKRFIAFVFQTLVGNALIFLVAQRMVEWFLSEYRQYILLIVGATLILVYKKV